MKFLKLSILGNGCVREDTLEIKFIEKLKDYGLERAKCLEESDYLLYITCAGVADTIRKCLHDLYLLKRCKPKKTKVIIVGCLTKFDSLFDALKDDDSFKIIKNRDFIIPVFNYIASENKRNSYKTRLTNRTRFLYKTNTSIQFFLEDGCSNRCTFCKTNYNNSRVISVPYEHALEHLRNLIRTGTRSITFSGENTTLYGIDLYKERVLHKIIHEISNEEGLLNIRINELCAANMYPELIYELVNNPKVKSVGMQLETASDRLLKLMGRNHTLEQYDYYVRLLRDAGKYVDTVLMSGFPTETYDDLDLTIDYLKNRGIYYEGVCEYVDFGMLPSSKFPQIPDKEKRQHTKYLLDHISIVNFNLLSSHMKSFNTMLFIGNLDGYHIFECDNSQIALSQSKRFEDLEPGNVIDESPKRLVKKSKFNGKNVYRV